MGVLIRIAKIAAGAFAFLVYLWFAAVLNAARAKRRKIALRAGGRLSRRRSRRSPRPAR